MSTSSQSAERGLNIKLAIIRVTAICSLIYSMLYLLAGFLLFTGALSQADEQVRTAAFVVLAISALPCLFMFLLAFFGFRAARDRLRMLPFCVVACIMSAFLLFNMVMAGAASVTTALDEGATGIIALAYNALVLVSAIVSLTIVAQNHREHGKVLSSASAADALSDTDATAEVVEAEAHAAPNESAPELPAREHEDAGSAE